MGEWVHACVRSCLVCSCVHANAHLSVLEREPTAGQCVLSPLPLCAAMSSTGGAYEENNVLSLDLQVLCETTSKI